MNEDDIRKHAEEVARALFDFTGHPDEITAEWLRSKHPELSAEEAEEYRLFCKSQTIDLMGCYGDGSIMWPRWQALKEEIAGL